MSRFGTNTALNQELARVTGFTGNFNSDPSKDEFQPFLRANPHLQSVVQNVGSAEKAMPVGIEPIHQYERSALTAMGGGNASTIAQSGMNPMTGQFLEDARKYGNKADTALQAGSRGFDLNEVQQFYNPAQEQVTQRAVSRLNDDAKKMQQTMIDRMSTRGSATMGDMYGAQQMGDIQQEVVKKTGDIQAEGAYQNWTDAVANMMQNRQNSLNAGNVYAGMMSPSTNASATAQSTQNAAFQNGLAGLNAQAGAGQRIQGFNQGVADISMGNYMGRQDYGNQLTNQTFGNFNTYMQPNMIQQQQQPQGNSGAAIGNVVGGLVGYGASPSSSTPWRSNFASGLSSAGINI